MATGVKINDDIARAARAESRRMHRSMTEQVEYWARLGRSLERLPGMSMARVRSVLDSDRQFDELAAEERAVALAALESLTFHPRGDRELQRDKARRGQSYTALDAAGRVIEVRPNGRSRVIVDPDAYGLPPDSAA